MENEVCQSCGKVHGKRVYLMPIEKIDVDSFKLIQNKLSCANQAANPSAIPDGVEEQKAKLFIQAAIDSLATYKWLEQDYWNQTIEKYNLPKDKNVHIDFNKSMFYYYIED
jgi:hypothetical protein